MALTCQHTHVHLAALWLLWFISYDNMHCKWFTSVMLSLYYRSTSFYDELPVRPVKAVQGLIGLFIKLTLADVSSSLSLLAVSESLW